MDYFDPATGGWLRSELHTIPDRAVRISARRKRELFEAQGTGRAIVVKDGRPALAPKPVITLAMHRAAAITAIKAEAARRIYAVATLERQSNDNAAIAAYALERSTGAASTASSHYVTAAMLRRSRIDAIRTASDLLEADVATWSAAALSLFDAGASARWPAEA